MRLKSYKELKVWQKAFSLALEVYRVTKKFPKSELYGLTSQIRRSVIAISSNIAEGYCRRYRAEYIQFLRIAFASGAELETQLLIAKEVGLLNDEDYQGLDDLLGEVMRMLNSLMRNLEEKAKVRV